MSKYLTMAKRIRACGTLEELTKASKSLVVLYNAGVFTESELMRLDGVSVDQSILIEEGVS